MQQVHAAPPLLAQVYLYSLCLRAAAAAAAAAADFDYTQVSGGAYGAGLIHRGYRNASDEIWGDGAAGLQAVLQKYIVKASTGPPITSVLFAGHSMGGGLGTLLAARTQVSTFAACSLGLRVVT
jgi:hypothetical protein